MESIYDLLEKLVNAVHALTGGGELFSHEDKEKALELIHAEDEAEPEQEGESQGNGS